MTYRTADVHVSAAGRQLFGNRSTVVRLAGKAKSLQVFSRYDVSALGQRHLSEFGTLFEQLLPSSFLFLPASAHESNTILPR